MITKNTNRCQPNFLVFFHGNGSKFRAPKLESCCDHRPPSSGDIPQHSPLLEILYFAVLRMSRLDVIYIYIFNLYTLEKTVGNWSSKSWLMSKVENWNVRAWFPAIFFIFYFGSSWHVKNSTNLSPVRNQDPLQAWSLLEKKHQSSLEVKRWDGKEHAEAVNVLAIFGIFWGFFSHYQETDPLIFCY